MQPQVEKRVQAIMCIVFGILIIAFTINYHTLQWEMEISRRRRMLFHTLQMNSLQIARQYQAYARHHPYFPEFTRARQRRMWAKKRSTDWWDRIVLKEFTDSEWIENFRMTKQTFSELCDTLRCKLAPKPNFVRTPISVEKKVAVALYKLASCCEYRIVANQFGIHKSSVHNIIYSFCNAIIEVLVKHTISMPNEVECEELSHLFELKCGIPQVIGAIDGTHIPILAPADGFRDFVNRKGWPSYNVQAVVDVHYRFRDITCKHSGSAHDACVLKDSFLFKNVDEILPQGDKMIDCRKIPFMILGDPAYPLLPWLMKGFRTRGNDVADEESFNAYLSKGRIVVENAFGRLKGRWRCLLKRNDISYRFMPKVIVACCILHNLVETRKETFLNQWLDNVRDAEFEYPQPHAEPSREDGLVGSEIRNTLKEYMARNFPLLQSKFR